MPTTDSILGDLSSPVVATIRTSAPLLVTIINTLLIPPLVRHVSDGTRWQSGRMLLVSRLATTWLVPALVVVAFSNDCGRYWLRWWK